MKTSLRYYKNIYPEIGSFILGKVVKITKYGITIILLEYNNIEAFANFKDASNRRRLIAIKRELKINTNYPFYVKNVDINTGNIDLTKKYQTKDEEKVFIDYLKKYKFCMSILKKFFYKINMHTIHDQELILEKTYWKYDPNKLFALLKSIKNDISQLYTIFDLEKDQYTIFHNILKLCFKDIKYTIKYNIRINSLSINGKSNIITFLEHIHKKFYIVPIIKSVPIYLIEFQNILEDYFAWRVFVCFCKDSWKFFFGKSMLETQ